MDKKNINYKLIISKVFFTYLVVYFFALIFKYSYDFESLLKNIEYKYLIGLNLIIIILGLPLSIIFDFILVKIFGLYYVLFFSPALTILSLIQVFFVRKIQLKFPRSIFSFRKKEKNKLYKVFDNITFRPLYILIIRSFPILPHILGSYIIASSKIKKRVILINTLLGSYFYYFLLFMITM